MAAPPTKLDIIHSYRRLLRNGLRAVHFSQPSRGVLLMQLRRAFRDEKELKNYDRERILRTSWFLKIAGQENGLESAILKNLVRVHWEREERREDWRDLLRGWRVEREGKKQKLPDPVKGTEYEHYERTIQMLNDTMGLCLR